LAYLQTAMAARLIHYGLRELDGAVIRQARREFTQEISLHVFGCGGGTGAPMFKGIAYESRLGSEFTNWAIFERPDHDPVHDVSAENLRIDDPDLRAFAGFFAPQFRDGS